MSNINQLILEVLNKTFRLEKFDFNFYKTIKSPKEYNLDTQLNHPRGHFYTVIKDGNKVAIVGVIFLSKPYFQIAVHQDYRRQGLVGKSADLIAKKYNLKELVSVVSNSNTASLGAHKKAGFVNLTDKEYLEFLKNRQLVKKNTTLLIKKYQ